MSRIFAAASDAYREQRTQLLLAERALRTQREEVAARRRSLPPGPTIDDYELSEARPETGRMVRLSELFGDRDVLVLYNMMYGPEWGEGCPMCSMWLDGLNGVAHHLNQNVSFAVVAKADSETLRRWAAARGWSHLRILSSRGSMLNADLGLEGSDENEQMPGVTVLTRDEGGIIRLFYAGQADLGDDDSRTYEGDPRGLDGLSPVWNLLDLTPRGRGDWYPNNTPPDDT